MIITARRHLGALFLALLALPLSTLSWADSSVALETVESATNRILALIDEAQGTIAEEQREPYYRQASEILNEVVDFVGFARSVMATHASARQYNALQTDAERQQFNDRIQRFAATLEHILVHNYADAVLSFNVDKVALSIAPGSDTAPRRAVINQRIHGNTGNSYLVQYTMREQQPGVWKVTNLVVDGINFGQIYRTQFTSEVEKAGGDVDSTIDNWGKSGGR